MAMDEPSALDRSSEVTVLFAALIYLPRTHRQEVAHCSPTRLQVESQDAAQWGNLGPSREPESLSVPVRDPEVVVVTDQPSAPKTPSEVTFPFPTLIFLSRTHPQGSASFRHRINQ
jgi:hypothetical protein